MFRFHYVLLPALALVFLVIYQLCLAKLYLSQGLAPVNINIDFWLIFLATMFVILAIFPSRIERPSDLFVFFYVLICVLWGSVLWGGTGIVKLDLQPLFFTIAIMPVFVLISVRSVLTRNIRNFVSPIVLASPSWLPMILTILLIIGGLTAMMTVGTGAFDWHEMYARRIEGRNLYEGQILAGYVTNIATNGILPILAFVAANRRLHTLLGIGVTFVIMMFFLLGLKSPAINFIVLGGLGFCFRHPFLRKNLVPFLLSVVLLVYIGALLEFLSLRTTYFADYLVRRISMDQPQSQSYYFDFWLNRDALESILTNSYQVFSDTTYKIGYLYLNNAQNNANANTFIYKLANNGLISYIGSMFIVTFILIIIDVFFEKTKRVEFFAIAGLFSILVTEQSWTTALLSSGIAPCLIMIMLFSFSPGDNSVPTNRI